MKRPRIDEDSDRRTSLATLAAAIAVLALAAPAEAQIGQPNPLAPLGPGWPTAPELITFSWEEGSGATGYHLYVSNPSEPVYDNGYSAAAICDQQTPAVCSVTLPMSLGYGEYNWAVNGYNSTEFQFSDTVYFNVGNPPTQQVTVLAPSQENTSPTPQYVWTMPVDTATQYRLLVLDAVGQPVVQELYPADATTCPSDCFATPASNLAEGLYAASVTPLNASGSGPQSAWSQFAVGGPAPPAPVQLSPYFEVITETQPAYVWDELLTANNYLLALYRTDVDPDQLVSSAFVDAASLCNGTTCTYAPGWTLVDGEYAWLLQGWNWMEEGPFATAFFQVVSAAPGAPVSSQPTGAQSTTYPVFQWDHVLGADSYELEIRDASSMVVFVELFTDANAICAAGVGSLCSTGAEVLDPGSYTWVVRGKNVFGFGAASTPLGFSIPASQLGAGFSHSMLVPWDDGPWAWGANELGQLGDGTTADSSVPVGLTDPNIQSLRSVALGESHSVVVTDAGGVYAWGSNTSGQLGRVGGDSTTPVSIIASGVARVAAGAEHTVALLDDETVQAWGSNAFGQVGVTGVPVQDTPVPVPGLSGIKAVAAGAHASFALASDGSIWAWGRNDAGQLGDGTLVSRHTPAKVTDAMSTPITGFVAIASGSSAHHVLAIQSDDFVWAWGDNGFGQIGDGGYQNALHPVQVSGLGPVLRVAVGERHSLVTLEDGTVAAWGDNSRYQLGDGGVVSESVTPVPVAGLSDIAYIASGQFHNLAIDNQGTLYAWGDNFNGQLGNGTTNPSAGPTLVSDPAFLWAVATPTLNPHGGAFFDPVNVILDTNTSTATLYYTTDGTEPDPASPSVSPGGTVPISGPATLKVKGFDAVLAPSVTAEADFGFVVKAPAASPLGGYFTSAPQVTLSTATAGATIYYTLDGSEPSPSSTQYAAPFAIGASATLKARAYLAGWSPSPLMTEDYTVDLTGIGAPSFDPPGGSYVTNQTVTLTSAPGDTIYYMTDGTAPTTQSASVSSGGSILVGAAMRLRAFASSGGNDGPEAFADYRITGAIAAGASQTFLLRADGTSWGAGRNNKGRLGAGTDTAEEHGFLQVSGLVDAQQIAMAAFHGVAVDGGGNVWSWGPNPNGQLGVGDAVDRFSPVRVTTLDPVTIVEVAAGDSHSLALDDAGNIWGWGRGDRNGTGAATNVPVQITSLTGVTTIAANKNISLALKDDGTVYSWGTDSPAGVLGRSTTPKDEPGVVPGIAAAKDVVLGTTHALVLHDDGSMSAWGTQADGRLGNGVIQNVMQPTPVPVVNLVDALSVASGDAHSFAIRDDGVLFVWGQNDANHRLGDGGQADRGIPGPVSYVQRTHSIGGGAVHSVALGADGRVWSWGSNIQGQLGVENAAITDLPFATELTSTLLPLSDTSWLSEDLDADGLSNGEEVELGTDPSIADTNGDGILDGAAASSGVSPTSDDHDLDGISNADERAMGADPFNDDTDGDGFLDDVDAFPLDPDRQVLPPYDPNDTTPPTITLEEPESAVLISSNP